MLCLVCYLFVISTSVIDCLGRFVPEMTYYVLSGTLNLTKLKLLVCSVQLQLSCPHALGEQSPSAGNFKRCTHFVCICVCDLA